MVHGILSGLRRMNKMNQVIQDARAIFDASIRSVQADQLFEKVDWLHLCTRPMAAYRRVIVASVGKASLAMASVIEDHLGDRIQKGIAVAPVGYPETLPKRFTLPRRFLILEGGHPIPDRASVDAASRVLRLAASCEKDDLFILLLSGGGSALCTSFVEGISLDDAKKTFQMLLESGADIHSMNAVRKHLSRIKGGQLARQAAPAEVVTLVVSDVVGDDLSVIASGPTVPDPSTFHDAVDVLRSYDLWHATPKAIRARLTRGMFDRRLETLKKDDPSFHFVRTMIVGSNRDATTAAAKEAKKRGYDAAVQAETINGEARDVGARLVREAVRLDISNPACLIWGGETTVTVMGSGKGGRNQEVALSGAIAMEGVTRNVVFLSGGTDGIDGPTDAAGACITPDTVLEARRKGWDPQHYLDNNDSYPLLDRLGLLLKSGPTHTNVMDVLIALLLPD